MKKLTIIVGLILAFGILSLESSAQTKVNVRFRTGTTTGSYVGSIRGARYIDYVLRAKGGQSLRVQLTRRSGAPPYFNVLPSGSEVAIADDARQATSYEGELPSDGVYVVRVYMEKGDRTNGRTSNFRISFRIEG